MARKRLGEILVQAGVLDEARLRVGLAEQRRWGGPLGRILVDLKLISEDAMVQALSHQLNFPAINLDTRQIPQEVLELVPGDLCEQHAVIPFNVQGKFLDVAMSDPTNLGIIDELRIRTRLNVRPYLSGPKSLERAIARFYGRGVATFDAYGGGTGARMLEVDGDNAFQQVQNAGQSPVGAAATAGGVGPRSTASMAAMNGAAAQAAAQQAAAAAPSQASARRAAAFELQSGPNQGDATQELAALQSRVQQLEALVQRDEDVLRKLMGLLIEKGLASRDEILERIK